MNLFVFSPPAKKAFQRLEPKLQQRIKDKLQSLKGHPDIFSVSKSVFGFEPATHRLRIGTYRLILEQKSSNKFLVLDLGHRREIYK